ncbi:hypothetical protein FJZ53_03985 [Candidatus Woesearchaeota archaeon]|nr:hypothetical protein [Candidatus Woesearchaeota archaeon]
MKIPNIFLQKQNVEEKIERFLSMPPLDEKTVQSVLKKLHTYHAYPRLEIGGEGKITVCTRSYKQMREDLKEDVAVYLISRYSEISRTLKEFSEEYVYFLKSDLEDLIAKTIMNNGRETRISTIGRYMNYHKMDDDRYRINGQSPRQAGVLFTTNISLVLKVEEDEHLFSLILQNKG